MKGLNVAYLNGAEGYKKIVLGSQNEGGNEGGNTVGGSGESNWIFIRPKSSDETDTIIVISMAGIIAMPFWSENSTISVIQTANKGILCCNPAYAMQIAELVSNAVMYGGAVKKGAKLVNQEANIDLTVNSFDDLVEFFVMFASDRTKEEILNSVEECSADEFMEMIAMP